MENKSNNVVSWIALVVAVIALAMALFNKPQADTTDVVTDEAAMVETATDTASNTDAMVETATETASATEEAAE